MIDISRVRRSEPKEVTDVPKTNSTSSRKYSWGPRKEKGNDVKMFCVRLWPVWQAASLRIMMRNHEGMQWGWELSSLWRVGEERLCAGSAARWQLVVKTFAFTVKFSPWYILGLGFISILISLIRKQIQANFITCLCSHITEWQRLDWFPGLSTSKVSCYFFNFFFKKNIILQLPTKKFFGSQIGKTNEQNWVEYKARGWRTLWNLGSTCFPYTGQLHLAPGRSWHARVWVQCCQVFKPHKTNWELVFLCETS